MKRFLALLIIVMLSLHLTNVSAEVFPNSLPGGKNYLNPENIEIVDGVLTTSIAVYVKPNQSYTISFPNRDMLGEGLHIGVEGNQTYIDEFAPGTLCIEKVDFISCSFTTSSNETGIQLYIESELIGLYYSYYNLQDFQLEEGTTRTSYEQYIPPYIDSTSPEFIGTGAYIKSYEETISLSEIVSLHILAFDEIDGDISDKIVVISDAYTGNESTIGEYLVVLSVSDFSGNESTFELYILVKDEIVPMIVGPSDIYIKVEEGNEISLMIAAYMDYSDAYDQNPVVSITHDDYTPNILVIGSYAVSFDVIDSSGNKATKDFTIHIEDMDPPVLVSSTTVNVDVSSPLTIDQIIDGVIASDNYDQTVDVQVFSDHYSGNQSVIGTYFVDIILSDDSGNITERTLMIHVNDTASPVIHGPTEITTSYTKKLNIEEIKNMYEITDNYDVLSNNNLLITNDGYSINSTVPGTYTVTLEVVDSTGNKSEHILEIRVVDDVSPIIYIDEYIVVVNQGSTFTENDMLKLLRLSNEISSINYQVHILQNEYQGNENIPGDYVYKVKLVDPEGSELIREFKITVQEETLKSDYTEPIVYTLIGVAVLTAAMFYKKYR